MCLHDRHRGTPLKSNTMRRIQNLLFKRKDADWVTSWNTGVGRDMYTKAQTVEKIIANSTMNQRCVLGFPHKDSDYWTPYTVEACKARYSSIGNKPGLKHFQEVEDAVEKKYSGLGGKRKRGH